MSIAPQRIIHCMVDNVLYAEKLHVCSKRMAPKSKRGTIIPRQITTIGVLVGLHAPVIGKLMFSGLL